MIRSVSDNFYMRFWPDRIIGLELFETAGDQKYFGVELRKKKNEVFLERTFVLNNLKELNETNAANLPVSLVINSDLVFVKSILTNTGSSNTLFETAFPGVDPGDFAFHTLNGESRNPCFLSVLRKNAVEAHVSAFDAEKIPLFDFQPGPLVMDILAGAIVNERLDIHHYSLGFADNQINQIQKVDAQPKAIDIRVGTDILPSTHVLAYAAGLNALVGNTSSRHDRVRNFLDSKVSRFLILAFLGVAFVLLIISTLLFFRYDALVQEKQFELYQLNEMLVTNEAIHNTLNVRAQVLEDAGMASQSMTSFYMDRLAQSLPDGIRLTQVVVSPEINKKGPAYEADAIQSFDQTLVEVRGDCGSGALYITWQDQLRNLEWVHDFQHRSFSNTSDGRSTFHFVLKLSASE